MDLVAAPTPVPGTERIGLLGGTFDPPHCGHLAAARACQDTLALDRVLLVVANDPWQKSPTRPISPAADRLAMVEAAVCGVPGLEVSTIEVDRGGPSYTVETVESLRRAAADGARPAPQVFVLIGADLAETLPTWHRVDDLRAMVTLGVVARPGSPEPTGPTGWRSVVVHGPGVDASSSQVRALVAAGADLEGLVPERVIRCIRRRGLYAVSR
jgi:nicotinate-nucleotide adenylyltransferase